MQITAILFYVKHLHSNGEGEKVRLFSGRSSVGGITRFQVKSYFCVVLSCIGPLPKSCLSQGVIGVSGLTHQLPRKLNCNDARLIQIEIYCPKNVCTV